MCVARFRAEQKTYQGKWKPTSNWNAENVRNMISRKRRQTDSGDGVNQRKVGGVNVNLDEFEAE